MSLDGKYIGRYQLLHVIGRGSMGEVYLARDPKLNRQVAIKLAHSGANAYATPLALQEATRLFLREAKAIAQLDHPNILPLFDYGEENVDGATLTYMVMPYRQEGSFSDWLHQRRNFGLLSLSEVVYFIQQAAEALQHAHNRQITHQDVKPSNFLIRNTEKASGLPDLLLADFGIAKFIMATMGESQTIRGTPAYMAPEQWSGNPVPASDQYALAVMAYELLTGELPFRGNPQQVMYQHFHVQPQLPSELNPNLPPSVNEVLLRALAKRPEDRFASVSAFARALKQAVASYIINAGQTTSLSISKKTASTNRPTLSRLNASILLYFIAIVLIGFLVGIVLNGINRLPPYVVSIASSLGAVIAVFSGLLGAILEKSFPKGIWQNANRPAAIFASILTVGLLAVPTVVLSSPAKCQALSTCTAGTTIPSATATVNGTYPPRQGKLVLNDPLTMNIITNNWLTYHDQYGSCVFSGGVYRISYSHQDYYLFCTAQTTNFSNFAFEAQMTIVQGDMGGIVFRVDNTSTKFYYFHINRNGRFGLDLIVDNTRKNSTSLASGYSPAIHTGLSETNVIAVVADNNTFDLYINYTRVTTAIDNSSSFSNGQIGLIADSFDAPTVILFSDVKVWTF